MTHPLRHLPCALLYFPLFVVAFALLLTVSIPIVILMIVLEINFAEENAPAWVNEPLPYQAETSVGEVATEVRAGRTEVSV